MQGLLPTSISYDSGMAMSSVFTLGAMGDSYYEYLLKVRQLVLPHLRARCHAYTTESDCRPPVDVIGSCSCMVLVCASSLHAVVCARKSNQDESQAVECWGASFHLTACGALRAGLACMHRCGS